MEPEISMESVIEQVWKEAAFAARFAFLQPILAESSPWSAMLEQAHALESLRTQDGALESWAGQYPSLFADSVEKIAQTPAVNAVVDQASSDLLAEFRAEMEWEYTRLSLTWIEPKPGSALTAECEVVGIEEAAALKGTVARCVRRGLRQRGVLLLAAQVTRSNGQGQAEYVPLPVPEPLAGQSESFSPLAGTPFDSETMEMVGGRRTAHAHEHNTVARVETPGIQSESGIIAKAQVIVYRTGAGQ